MDIEKYLFLTVLFYYFSNCSWASPHVHMSRDDPTKEREQDGQFVSRESKHYVNGQHRSEFDHEAIIGSHGEAEAFHKLNEEEAKKKLKIIFHKMDTNSDHFIDKKELIEWVLKSFSSLTLEEAQERLEDDDINEDGKVTWDEHLQETFGNFDDEYASENEIEEERKLIRDAEELFKAADVNQDGALDMAEYPAFSHPEEFTEMHELLFKQTMREKDRDGDGFVSLKEYLRKSDGSEPDRNSPTYDSDQDNFKSVYDFDQDGKLNREEVLNWLIPDNEEAATNEAEHLIHSSDDDDDGKLSLDEVINNHDTFVGSEITGYGEQLQNVKDEL